jgi:transcriptional regulator with XRE-family HTH domain
MPKRPSPSVVDSESNVAAHVQEERERRGWSTAELAKRVTEAGCPLSQSAVWRIESGNPRRKISVDELVAFGRVFGKRVDELLAPPSLEVPTDLVRLYVNKWVDARMHLHRVRVRVNIDLSQVLAAVWRFPAADALVREMIHDRLERTTGSARGARDLAPEYVADYEKMLRQVRDAEGPYIGLNPAEIIVMGREAGKADPVILAEAAELGVEDEVEDAMRNGVVHFVEPEFAGYLPLEFLTIHEGRLTRRPEAGRAAQALGVSLAKEAGLTDR